MQRRAALRAGDMAFEAWEAEADRRGYAHSIPELLPEIESLAYGDLRKTVAALKAGGTAGLL